MNERIVQPPLAVLKDTEIGCGVKVEWDPCYDLMWWILWKPQKQGALIRRYGSNARFHTGAG